MNKKKKLLQNIADLMSFLQTMNKEQVTQHKAALEQAVSGLGALTSLVGLIDDEAN